MAQQRLDFRGARRGLRFRHLPWTLLALLLACGETPAGETDTSTATDAADVQADGGQLDTAADVPADATDTTYACPGGHGCACEADADCTVSGRCLEGPGGAKACALPCAQATLGCAEGYRCAVVEPAGEGLTGGAFCVPRAGRLCDPCGASSDCATLGLPGAACVRYGDAGSFCGVQCLGDADCGDGYRCGLVERVEGGSAQQCVRTSEGGGGGFGECPCSPRAVAEALQTACRTGAAGQAGKCAGTRACSETGLSACSAPAPVAETCNGQDDDCDGATDEALCDDGNPCTTDSCDAGAGDCKHDIVAGPCSDGSACTEGDTCADGECAPGKLVTCDDGNACSDDACSAFHGCQFVFPATKACDDGNACTEGDACQGGVCRAGAPKACDDQNPCTEDSCGAGGCTAKAVDKAPCDDGDVCTGGDVCLCVPGAPGGATCQCAGQAADCDDGQACTVDSCDKATGCKHAAAADGGTCDDGDSCTTGEKCQGGECVNGKALACDDGNPCTVDLCQKATGKCATQLVAAGTTCSDGNACTTGDACQAGACQGQAATCDDGNACTTDSCLPASGCAHANNAAPCDDGSACTQQDACAGGSCTGQPLAIDACDDGNPCTADACEPKSGCVHPAQAGSCDDGNACTAGDTCAEGQCQPGVDQCVCQVDADCASEEDGDLCNGTLKCIDSKCEVDPATVVTCPTGGDTVCEKSTCEPASGKCAPKAQNDGKPCDDGDGCTKDDTCQAAVCKGGDACDDGNPCTDDACDKQAKACTHTANASPCDADGDLCTVDACAAGVCTGGAAKTCDDANGCTQDSCDKASGDCQFVAQKGQVCDDGDACTGTDVCQDDGTCKGAVPPGAVTVFAGSGVPGFADGKGAQASFQLPGGLAVDGAGEVVLADTENQRIRRITADGTVSTVAGDGTPGFQDGQGTAARFWDPGGVAVAADGTIYVADTGNHRIRVIAPDGAVTTLAGFAEAPGFGETPVGGYQDGQGTGALFDSPAALALDGGTLYVADTGNHRIRKITVADGTVTTLAGSGVPAYGNGQGTDASFNGPKGVAVGGAGVVYVADTGNHRIRAIAADGTVTLVAGNGQVGLVDGVTASARFKLPAGLTVDTQGRIYVADTGNHVLREIAAGKVGTLAGTGAAGTTDGLPADAKFDTPQGIAAAGLGVWYVSDGMNHRLRRVVDPAKACVP